MKHVLAGCGQRCQRAAVEALLCREDTSRAAKLLLAPAPCHLDGTLVCLCTGVGKERLPRGACGANHVALLVTHGREEPGEVARKLAAVLDIVVVAHLPDLVDLLVQGGGHHRIAVAHAHRANATQAVDIGLAGGVGERGALARNEFNGKTPIGVHHVGIVKGLGALVAGVCHVVLLVLNETKGNSLCLPFLTIPA